MLHAVDAHANRALSPRTFVFLSGQCDVRWNTGHGLLIGGLMLRFAHVETGQIGVTGPMAVTWSGDDCVIGWQWVYKISKKGKNKKGRIFYVYSSSYKT